MPAIGIEPIREYKSRRILSPGRLPVPPLRRSTLRYILIRATAENKALYALCTVFSTSHQWAEVDSNHRSKLQQIYSLSPLATRESIHIHFSMNKADDRTRTDNLLITNQLLCQLSHIGASFQHIFWNMGPIGLEPMTLCL